MEAFFSANPYLIPILCLVFWCLVLWLVARLSGWNVLAEQYQAFDTFEGATKRFSSVSFERLKGMPANYNGVVNVGADIQGLHLSAILPFRPYHPELVIPWSDVAAAERKILVFEAVVFSFARTPGVRLILRRPLAEWAATNSAGGLRLP